MDRPYQPRFTNHSRSNQSPNLSSASTPASPVGYHHPSHHGSPYAPELKHHRPSKSFSSSRNTPPPNSAYGSHGPLMDDRRYMSQPPPPPPPHPPHPSSHHRPPPMNSNNDKRPAYPGERVPNWNDNMDERFHDHRYRTHEQQQPHPQQQHPQQQQHPLHPPHPSHRDDRSAPPFHRQENATPPLSEGASSGRGMLNASPQMYRADRELAHPPPQPQPQHHPHPHPPQHYAQQPPGPPPPPGYPQQGPSLQSAQQQHHQLQQQLQQAAPGHHSGAPQNSPFPPQPLYSQPGPPPPGHPPPGHPPGPPQHHHHQRSASYSEPQHPQAQSPYHPSSHQPPNRPASTTNRPMPPPSPPHYPRTSQGPPPPHAQTFPPPSAGAPFGGTGRDLPSISSLEIPREIHRSSNMSLSSILGDAPPGPPVRLESLTQSIFREPTRTLGPDLSPLKRPYTPGDRPMGGHAIEPSRSNSPPGSKNAHFSETRTPPYRHGSNIQRHRDAPHFSPPTRPLSQPTFPPQSEPQPPQQQQLPPHHPPPPHAHPHQPPPAPYHPQERISEREQYAQPPPHFRQQNHLRTSSYPDSPYRQAPEPPRREPSPPRSIQHPHPPRQAAPNASPPLSQQTQIPQPQPSPSYHHPPPPTSSAASLSFNAYTTQMPDSPFAITPALSNQHTISSLHQYDTDRKKPNGSALGEPAQIHGDRPPYDQKPWDREHLERERSTDIPPLRAEEALVKGIHERKYPGTFTPISQSPKLKREVIVIDEHDPSMLKKDDHDIEMGGVEMTMSPMRRGEPPVERATKRRKGYYAGTTAPALNSGLRSDSTLSNLDDPTGSLGSTPVKIGGYTSAPAASPANTVPTIPPQQLIDSSDVLAELKTHERHHLGSMVYTPTLLKKSGSVKSYSHIPLFLDRENCTFIVRVPWYCLNLEERERVCRKRLLWGAEVYSDDSNILAVLVHLGYIPAVRDGQEVAEYAEAHDAVVAKLSAPKRRGAGGNKGRELAVAMMAENGSPKMSGAVQVGKDLLVKIVIVGNLGKYSSVVRYGLKSRSWEDGHDGMGFMVEDVKWVDGNAGFGDVRGGKGVHGRLKKWEKLRRKNDIVETLVTSVTSGKGKEINGSKWLLKEGAKEEEKENVMEVDGVKEKEAEASASASAAVVAATA
ncbi:hypothetical protein H072_7117 [Dactylellina haptotyla CBS 200.50]|uniref:Histone deacetylation protein Rxt3 n=1 Tax=Dactylellina haptotyla (strain CBS 200.50) TaxID=1284197 RepID=S8A8C9_DACHA|nr:hypothetical protein H072_7117 [Dactylellina haptotyla CBS 200.50]